MTWTLGADLQESAENDLIDAGPEVVFAVAFWHEAVLYVVDQSAAVYNRDAG